MADFESLAAGLQKAMPRPNAPVPLRVLARLGALSVARPTGAVEDENGEFERFITWRDGEWFQEPEGKYDSRLCVEFYLDKSEGRWEGRWFVQRKHKTVPSKNRTYEIAREHDLVDTSAEHIENEVRRMLVVLDTWRAD